MAKSNKTSKADFEAFKKTVVYWQNKLGLTDWKLYLSHDTVENTLAWVRRDNEGRCASIGLSVNWEHQKVSRKLINECALHEVLHILLANLRYAGQQRQTTETDFSIAEHEIIRRLEKVLK